MGFFKEKEDYVDYTLLSKKGLLKDKEEKLSNSNDVIDFTSLASAEVSTSAGASVPISSPSMPSANEPSNPFGFLDAPSGSSESSSSQNSSYYGDSSSSIPALDAPAQINSLKIKVEDLEYKLERLLEKLSLFEGKLSGFENKTQ